MIFDLVQDFTAVLAAMPAAHPRRRILKLLDEATRRDVHFIHRHPTTLFQCLWNTCWWYDCREAASYYADGKAPGKADGVSLCRLLEGWRAGRELTSAGRPWLRSLGPPRVHLSTGCVAILCGHADAVEAAVIAADGGHIVSVARDNTVRIWDSESGAELQRFHNIGRAHNAAFFPLPCLAVSPEGERIVTRSESGRAVQVWDARSGTAVMTLGGRGGEVTGVAISADGQYIVGGAYDDTTVRVWSMRTGKPYRELLGHTSDVISVAISQDASRIAGGAADGTARVWDMETGAQLHTLSAEDRRVVALAISPDGRRVVAGGDNGELRVWDAESGRLLHTLGLPKTCPGFEYAISILPDGRRVASGGAWDTTIRVWEIESGQEVHSLIGHEGYVSSVFFSADGRLIVSAGHDATIRIWDGLYTSTWRPLRGHQGKVTCLAVSTEAGILATGSYDKTVRIWDIADATEVCVLRGHENSVERVGFFPDGSRLVSASSDNTVRVWDARQGSALFTLPGDEDGAGKILMVSPNGRLILSVARSNKRFVDQETIRVWDAETGVRLHTLRGDFEKIRRQALSQRQINEVAVSGDSRRIVSGSGSSNCGDYTVRIWDAESGAELHTLFGHEGPVNSVAISPDGRHIASGSSDKTVRIWDAGSGVPLRTLRMPQEVGGVAYSPDGRQIVCRYGFWATTRSTVEVWDIESGASMESIPAIGNLPAMAAGPDLVPWRALCRIDEMVIESASDGRPAAWFPEPILGCATRRAPWVWAGVQGLHLYLIALEGPECGGAS